MTCALQIKANLVKNLHLTNSTMKSIMNLQGLRIGSTTIAALIIYALVIYKGDPFESNLYLLPLYPIAFASNALGSDIISHIIGVVIVLSTFAIMGLTPIGYFLVAKFTFKNHPRCWELKAFVYVGMVYVAWGLLMYGNFFRWSYEYAPSKFHLVSVVIMLYLALWTLLHSIEREVTPKRIAYYSVLSCVGMYFIPIGMGIIDSF